MLPNISFPRYFPRYFQLHFVFDVTAAGGKSSLHKPLLAGGGVVESWGGGGSYALLRCTDVI